MANGLEIPKTAITTISKLNTQKCEHFLDFLFNNKLLHVAYGVTNLKPDNEDCQKITNVSYKILTHHFILLGSLQKFWL